MPNVSYARIDKITKKLSRSVIPDGGNYFEKTYEELRTLIENDGLVPGAKYVLNDYVTKYRQPYTDVIKTADIQQGDKTTPISDKYERLVLTAVSENQFNLLCSSLDYPQDIVYYDFFDNVVEKAVTAQTLSFYKSDGETKGAWNGKYGKDGYILFGYKGTPLETGVNRLSSYKYDIVKSPGYLKNVLENGIGKAYRIDVSVPAPTLIAGNDYNPNSENTLDVPSNNAEIEQKIQGAIGAFNETVRGSVVFTCDVGSSDRIVTIYLQDWSNFYKLSDPSIRLYTNFNSDDSVNMGNNNANARLKKESNSFNDNNNAYWGDFRHGYLSFKVSGKIAIEVNTAVGLQLAGVFFDTPRDITTNRPGFIQRRIDTKFRLDVPQDWRTMLWARFKASANEWKSGSVTRRSIYQSGNYLYMAVKAGTPTSATDANFFVPIARVNEYKWSKGFNLTGLTYNTTDYAERYTFNQSASLVVKTPTKASTACCEDIIVESPTQRDDASTRGLHNNTFMYSYNDSDPGFIQDSRILRTRLGHGSNGNTLYSGFGIYPFYDNDFGSNFNNNTLGCYVFNNKIGANFSNNFTGVDYPHFNDNNILSSGCSNNLFASYYTYNTWLGNISFSIFIGSGGSHFLCGGSYFTFGNSQNRIAVEFGVQSKNIHEISDLAMKQYPIRITKRADGTVIAFYYDNYNNQVSIIIP